MIRFLAVAVFATLLGAAGGKLVLGGQPVRFVNSTALDGNDRGADDEIGRGMRHNVERSTL